MANETLKHEFVTTDKGVSVICEKSRGRCARLYRPSVSIGSGTVQYFGSDLVVWDTSIKGQYVSPPLEPGLYLLTKFAAAGKETDNSGSLYFEVGEGEPVVVPKDVARQRLVRKAPNRDEVMAALYSEVDKKRAEINRQIADLQEEEKSLVNFMKGLEL